jgi:hypothetical protein
VRAIINTVEADVMISDSNRLCYLLEISVISSDRHEKCSGARDRQDIAARQPGHKLQLFRELCRKPSERLPSETVIALVTEIE